MIEYRERYYRLNIDFPNKAGKLSQVLATQKRLIEKLMKQKTDDATKELIHAVAEGYDVANELMEYMKSTLQNVADDAEALIEGSDVREKLQFQSEILSEYLHREINYLEETKKMIHERAQLIRKS